MTNTSPRIAVAGSTGHLGGLVAARLSAAGVAQRLLVRSADRAPRLAGADPVETSYEDHDRSVAALDGIDVVFMTSAPESTGRLDQHRTFIDAAAHAGVGHIVYTSFYGASPDVTFTLGREHWATEEHIRASGLRHTFLRDNFYLEFLATIAGADGVIRGPAADGRLAGVARADIADVAAAVLIDHGSHVDTTYDLTGGEALSLTDVAALLSQVTGRTVTYQAETIEEAYASRASYGAADWEVDAWVTTYTAIANGEVAAISPHVEQVTGHRPLTLSEILTAR